ncbi:MAG: hypothetical protein HS111_01130 [Kofleriaceae bacterium]|nr:hypothetical protein [Kofleriaceae bacterium]MCL4226707.1 hypothetical protein [Myxococcales bacterium]
MSLRALDRDRLLALLATASERLEGEWLVVGDAAAAAWFSTARVTEDIDLVPLDPCAGQRLALMELAAASGLPVEAVNSAADFFVRRVDGWRDELVPLLRGPRATIHRPSATLFLLLELERLSATDLADCVELLDHTRATGEVVDVTRVRDRLAALPAADDDALVARRAQLAARLATT